MSIGSVMTPVIHDADGDIVLCKCGKVANESLIGEKAFVALCSTCGVMFFGKKQSAEFVYRPKELTEEEKQKLMQMGLWDC